MTIGAAAPAIRRRLAGSDLVRAGGFARFPLLGGELLGRLRAEATALHPYAQEQRTGVPEDEDTVAGNPARWLDMAAGGVTLDALYRGAALRDELTRLTGVRWQPSGGAGTYSYYHRAGHHLDVHRDTAWCDLAVIVCVRDSGGRPDRESGVLQVYPSRIREAVSAIRGRPAAGALPVRLRPGEAVALLGGVVAHRLVPLDAGQVRVVAPLCYRPLS